MITSYDQVELAERDREKADILFRFNELNDEVDQLYARLKELEKAKAELILEAARYKVDLDNI